MRLPRLPLVPRELHASTRLSTTAQWTTLVRALELRRRPDERIVTDVYAPAFLRGATRTVAEPLAALPTRWAQRSEYASIATSVLCRHRFLDLSLLEALPEVEQVVVLGAGYDSRAYRFRRAIGGRPVYEVDLPPTSRQKAAVVTAHPELFGPASVRRVEIDFRTQSLAEVLVAAGFVVGATTFVVWEGVSMYLTRDAVAGTFGELARLCGRGSTLAMDCWRHVGGFGVYDVLRRAGEHAVALVGEPLTFAVSPDDIAGLLSDAGLRVADLATADDLTRRHATDGRRCDAGLYVLAAVVG